MRFLSPDERRKLLLKTPQMFSRLIVAGIPIFSLLKKKALIVGAGGLGVIVAEILARSGIGEMYIIDRDIVREENFNRLGYFREDIGRPKAHALAEKIKHLRNSKDVPPEFHIKIRSFNVDIVGWDRLEALIKEADIIFSCLDNEIGRRELNFLAMKYKKPLIDGATSIDGLNGTIITILPCKTPCYECYYGSDMSVKVNTVERIGFCDASLATTMSIVAALQADQGLKVLLGYKEISHMIKISLFPKLNITMLNNVKPREDCPIHRRFCK